LTPPTSRKARKDYKRGGKLEQDVWVHFAFEPNDLSKTAKAIRQLAEKRQIPIAEQDEDADFAEAEEGRILTLLS
jgi:hypothetical protein